MDTVVTFI